MARRLAEILCAKLSEPAGTKSMSKTVALALRWTVFILILHRHCSGKVWISHLLSVKRTPRARCRPPCRACLLFSTRWMEHLFQETLFLKDCPRVSMTSGFGILWAVCWTPWLRFLRLMDRTFHWDRKQRNAREGMGAFGCFMPEMKILVID